MAAPNARHGEFQQTYFVFIEEDEIAVRICSEQPTRRPAASRAKELLFLQQPGGAEERVADLVEADLQIDRGQLEGV
jgi:hypothetical protein